MGFLDKLKGKQGDLVGKAKELAVEHGDKVESAIDKVGDVVDQRTKGKYAEKIDSAQAKAKDALEQERIKQGKADPLTEPGPVAEADPGAPGTNANPGDFTR